MTMMGSLQLSESVQSPTKGGGRFIIGSSMTERMTHQPFGFSFSFSRHRLLPMHFSSPLLTNHAQSLFLVCRFFLPMASKSKHSVMPEWTPQVSPQTNLLYFLLPSCPSKHSPSSESHWWDSTQDPSKVSLTCQTQSNLLLFKHFPQFWMSLQLWIRCGLEEYKVMVRGKWELQNEQNATTKTDSIRFNRLVAYPFPRKLRRRWRPKGNGGNHQV